MKTFAFLAAVLAATVAVAAHAEERRIQVYGTGTAEAAPDMATITVGVTNQDAQASAAMQATSDAVATVLSRLSEMGIESRDLQTRDLSLSPVWSGRGNADGEAPRITGFVASNRVFVRVRSLDDLGQIMDAVIQDGANDFGGLTFTIQDPKPLEAKARAQAVADATAKAEQLAQAAGVTLGSVVSINEQGGGIRPMPQMREMAMADSGGVPVAGGEVSVSVTVLMEFDISE
ncbi:SIMPL domain-containing protein [Ruegeria arenilitoris]|uniref:SIMPL domain-containing protein n=1 Tax=Ruegeria arenilitoris TaxID=1173585 RepID=UPI00147D0B66|nr:SIMPL domain-containing protein [Ruegeria arenilitoris]